MAEPLRLLVVCLGNICRSPMAEGVLRARIAASPLAGRVEVDSAGTGDWHVGHAPDPRAVAMAARHHVDISGQRARQFGVVDAGQHDWLLCADTTNLRDVRARLPHQDRARAALLLDWCDGSVAGAEVPDPYTGGEPEFEYAWRLLDTAAQAAVQRLLQLPVSRWRS